MSSFVLGLDAGTSVIKAVVFDRQMRPQGSAHRPTRPVSPRPGWSEVDMTAVWEAAAGAIQAALAAAGRSGRDMAAVGVTGNMVGAWLIDWAGRPVRPAILWNDGRTQTLIERREAGHPDFMAEIFRASGSVMQQGCTLPLMRWLAEHEPDALAEARAVFGCKDWLRFQLTGDVATDPTEASVAPGDARTRGRSEAMFDLMELGPWRHLFPAVRASEAVAGTVTDRAAATTGLAAGTPVVTGAGDVAASTLGCGAHQAGVAPTILGTTCLNCLTLATPSFAPPDLGLLFCVPGGLWLRAMVNVAGTSNLDWALARLVGPRARDAEAIAAAEARARASPIGARGVVYLPYLSPVGIIAPFVEPRARAGFFGLTDDHGDGDLLRAVYEGVALSVRDGYGAIGRAIDEIRLIGGGARSALWPSMIADCTGRPVVTLVDDELGARGAALLAGRGVGWFGALDPGALPMPAIATRHEPSVADRAAWDSAYARYARLRDALRPVWRDHPPDDLAPA